MGGGGGRTLVPPLDRPKFAPPARPSPVRRPEVRCGSDFLPIGISTRRAIVVMGQGRISVLAIVVMGQGRISVFAAGIMIRVA